MSIGKRRQVSHLRQEVVESRQPDAGRVCDAAGNSALHVFDRCGHWPQVEHTMAFNRFVQNFLCASD